MKVKISLVLLITLFFILGFILTPVLGGDETNPEVDDETGETNEPGREFRDIESAWFGPETNDTIMIYLKLAGSPLTVCIWVAEKTAHDHQIQTASPASPINIQHVNGISR